MRRDSSSKARHQAVPDSEQLERRQVDASVRSRPGLSVLWLLGCLLPGSVSADGLADDLGRNEVRVYATRFRVEPGRTITQQLVKLRDMSPKRSMGRKASEAVRALALEAEYDKTEILAAYLDTVYFGHLDGIHIFGFDTAARAYFSKPASQLDSGESALLAAMDHDRPTEIVELWIETETGLLLPRYRDGAELDLFRKGATPPKRRPLMKDEPIPIIE